MTVTAPDDHIGLYEGLLTTRAIRRYRDEPVPDEVLRDILFAATRAPSGSNRQPFRFVVLTDGPVAAEAKRAHRVRRPQVLGGQAQGGRVRRRIGRRPEFPQGPDGPHHAALRGRLRVGARPRPRLFRGLPPYVARRRCLGLPGLPEPPPGRPGPGLRGGHDHVALCRRGGAARPASDTRRHEHHGHHHPGSTGRFPRPGPPPTHVRAGLRRKVGRGPAVGRRSHRRPAHGGRTPAAPPKVEGGRPRHPGRHHMHTLDTRRLRRRQPLLRGARCLHPAPRPRPRAPGHPVGRRRRAQVPRLGWADQPGRDQSHLRPDLAGRLPDGLFPGQSRRPSRCTSSMGTPEPIRPEYRDRDARLGTMDTQGLDQVWLFPTLGHALRGSPQARPGRRGPACSAPSTAGWPRTGASRTGTGSSPPRTSPWPTPKKRSGELEWALDQDARAVVMRAAAPTTATGPRLPVP